MIVGSTSVTTQGGPRQISLFAGSTPIYSHVIDLTGVPTDRQNDANSPYHLTYNPATGKATISGTPPGSSFVELYYRKKGAPEQDNYIVGSKSLTGQPYSITLSAAGMPSDTGYLEAEFLGNKTYDTNELQLSQGLPVGQAPEVPWAAGIPVIGVGTAGLVALRHRKTTSVT